jgi:hypothetical protein
LGEAQVYQESDRRRWLLIKVPLYLKVMNRYDKLEWLEQTTSPQFMQETLVQEMVRWMGEDEFEQFYDHLCRMWEIARSPEELEELANA